MTVRIRTQLSTDASSEGRWATMRDHQVFLDALDENDGDTLQQLAPALAGSFLTMPDDACLNIGVPVNSSFGAGVRALYPQEDFSANDDSL